MSLTKDLTSSQENIQYKVERYKMGVEGYKVLLKNTPKNEIDLKSEAKVPSLSGAERTKKELRHKLKEAPDKATICVVDATGTLPTNSVVQSLL